MVALDYPQQTLVYIPPSSIPGSKMGDLAYCLRLTERHSHNHRILRPSEVVYAAMSRVFLQFFSRLPLLSLLARLGERYVLEWLARRNPTRRQVTVHSFLPQHVATCTDGIIEKEEQGNVKPLSFSTLASCLVTPKLTMSISTRPCSSLNSSGIGLAPRHAPCLQSSFRLA